MALQLIRGKVKGTKKAVQLEADVARYKTLIACK